VCKVGHSRITDGSYVQKRLATNKVAVVHTLASPAEDYREPLWTRRLFFRPYFACFSQKFFWLIVASILNSARRLSFFRGRRAQDTGARKSKG
jgi:hypothetical protein